MMNFYNMYINTYMDGNLIADDCFRHILAEDKEAENKIIQVTWSNLLEVMQDYGSSMYINVYTTKKGLKISTPNSWKTIKQWKKPELNMKLYVTYKPDNSATIADLKYKKVDTVIQYFTERGALISLDKLI